MFRTNASSLPETASASASAASLAEAITTLLTRSRTGICSPSFRNICEPPMEDARVLAVTLSSHFRLPASIASMTSRSVMIFVTDAGGMASSAFCSYRTCPVAASIRIAPRQSNGSGFCTSVSAAGTGVPDCPPVAVGSPSAAHTGVGHRHRNSANPAASPRRGKCRRFALSGILILYTPPSGALYAGEGSVMTGKAVPRQNVKLSKCQNVKCQNVTSRKHPCPALSVKA